MRESLGSPLTMSVSAPPAYAFLPLSSRKVFARSDAPPTRAFMKESTTVAASSSAVGWGGSAGAVPVHSAPPRRKANEMPFGAQSGVWYVPLASLVRLVASGRTW